jgi:excisionase family DNA binding protein
MTAVVSDEIKPANLTVSESVRFTGIKTTKLYEYLSSGQLRAIKSGRRTLIPVAELNRLLDSMPAYKAR